MNKNSLLWVLLLWAFLSPLMGNQEKAITDDLGHTFRLQQPPQRIISLAPNITEILFALGLEDRIIGVTRYCDYPPPARTKEVIGGMLDPNIEKIQSLNPDLIIGFRGNPLRILNRLHSLELPVFVLQMGSNLESVFSVIQKIGTITQTGPQAEELVHSLKEEHRHIQKALQGVQKKPKVFLSLHGKGFWTSGRESFIHDLIQKAQGINIAGQISRRWLLFNREQILHENPDIILILSRTEKRFREAKKWIQSRDYLQNVQAVQKNQIYFIDEDLATRPGPRLLKALSRLARIFHPQRFHSPS